jgi:hypothetical protein
LPSKINFARLIKEYRDKTDKTIPQIAQETGLNLENLYKWSTGTKPSNFNDQLTLLFYLSEEVESIPASVFNEAPISNFINPLYRSPTVRLPLKSKRKPFPNPDASIACGHIVDNDGEPELIVFRFDAPFLIQVEGALQILDDSMYPTYKPGSYIAIARLHDWSNIIYGDCYYMIDKSGHGMFRRIFKGNKDDDYRLVADNSSKRFPSNFRSQQQIEAILRVIGGFKYDDKFPAMDIPAKNK